MKPALTRRPIFWLAFLALALAGAGTAVLLFSTALPSISVDIRMDRGAAIDSAAALAARSSWGDPDDRSAATFGLVDPEVQTFVELEGGGSEVVERLAAADVYHAYQWRVRRFAEGRVEESTVRFTPSGEPYGFRLRLAQDDPGAGNLTADEARPVAEATAASWGVDLGAYELSEASSETLPGGRVDHTFVYERTDERLADSRFRLRLVVAGERATELTHFVNVPESFSRRYADMRSTNDTIALLAQAVFLLAFVLLGAGVGSALLLRQRWLEWRPPLLWGSVIAFLFGAASVNRLPLSWTAYDTALSSASFALQQIAGGVAIALLGTPLIAFFLMAGESLDRKAFPDHVQQWRFWSRDVAPSSTALGMTAAAYGLVGLQLGYVVLFYLGSRSLEGWWSPSDALVQPDLLATYFPWLEAVSLALFASFWEESVFRAVPIACAALLGARFGRKGSWVWGAVVLQAVVFAASHANYPQQPPYARVIELTAPALVWGVVYVRYGLVPTILAHYLYDLSLISIVLFESEAFVDQAVIVLAGLAPLGVVTGMRLRHGARAAPPESAYNRSWRPRERPEGDGPAAETSERASASEAVAVGASASTEGGTAARGFGVTPRGAPSERAATLPGPLARWGAPSALVVGIVVSVVSAMVGTQPPRLWGDRSRAISVAEAELAARGVPLLDRSVLVTTASGATSGRGYVFAEATAAEFEALEGTYFGVPRWLVRFVDWDADPAERVEEYRVWVGPEGRVDRVSHTLPEARPGSDLTADQARPIALDAVADWFGLRASDVREVEAQETSRPGRTDWLFTFTQVDRLAETDGEARIEVRISGDEVTDVAASIFIPEDWERSRRRLESRNGILTGGLVLLLVVGFVAAAVTGVVTWSRHGLPGATVAKLTGAAFVSLLAAAANDWPSTAASFSTAQPWSFQAGATLVSVPLVACVLAPAIGLVGGLAHAWLPGTRIRARPPLVGPALGVLLAGLMALGPLFVPRPPAASYLPAASAVPVLAPALNQILAALVLSSGLLLVVALRRRFGGKVAVTSIVWGLLVAVALVAVPLELRASPTVWGVVAALVAAVLGLGMRVCSTVPLSVPGVVCAFLAVRTLLGTWYEPWEGARVGGLVDAVALGVLAWLWTRHLGAPAGEPGSELQSPMETRASVGSE